MIDIKDEELKIIKDILQQYVPNAEVMVFGSRVNGTAREYSDIDLAIKAKDLLTLEQRGNLKEAFEESDLPFRVDYIDWHTTDENFRKIILKQKINI